MTEMVTDLVGRPETKDALHEKTRLASPCHIAESGCAAHLIVHGGKDPIVPLWHATGYHERLRVLAADSTLVIVKEAGHDPASEAANSATLDFFRKHLL